MTCRKCGAGCFGPICAGCNGERRLEKSSESVNVCRVCGRGCFGGICKDCNGEEVDMGKSSRHLMEAISAFREDHMHLIEADVIESLNKEMPNWDYVIADKFILFCKNLGVIEPDWEYGVRRCGGDPMFYVVRVGTTYIDWASKRRFPSIPWPKVWEMNEID